jgi:hypothetical protein
MKFFFNKNIFSKETLVLCDLQLLTENIWLLTLFVIYLLLQVKIDEFYKIVIKIKDNI